MPGMGFQGFARTKSASFLLGLAVGLALRGFVWAVEGGPREGAAMRYANRFAEMMENTQREGERQYMLQKAAADALRRAGARQGK